MHERRIYLDNHATTRVDPRVVEAMLPFWSEIYGNPASTSHDFGWEAKDAVDDARSRIAAAIGASSREIVFTSGATESNNLAIRGVTGRNRRRGEHLVSVATEHRAVLDPLARLARRGFEVTILGVEPATGSHAGRLDPQTLAAALRDDTLLVSVMLANNEIGVLQPLADIGRICRARGVLLHCDATQAVGRIPVDVGTLGIDLLSFSAHKIYGPKGVGALYVRQGPEPVRLDCQIAGGGHERGMRSGTLNVPGIVGFACALDLCLAEMPTEAIRLAGLRDRLFAGLTSALDGVTLNGPALDLPGLRLPGNLNASFACVDGEALIMNVKQLAVSSGSACTSADPAPSHVLAALGLSDDAVRSSLRFGLGRFNTDEEIDFSVSVVAEVVERLRKLSSLA
ncbi:MAG TPA: aminotransferase class V-fold PLP-dependent enzyme [Pirellulales bacterium]|jgi:cysteine desulfurase|nr:aminotransferase class V-fold PLP-dependent enzyme [Pirellulales bacterium]